MAPTKRKKAKSRMPKSQRMPFPFLDLPAEIRNLVYILYLEDGPAARLSRNTKNRNLGIRSPLLYLNKQIHREFSGLPTACSPKIETVVRDFNFSHIVTFLNRLSKKELEEIKCNTDSTNDEESPLQRRLCIKLAFTGSLDLDDDIKLFTRWINRVESTEKKGFNIAFEYKYLGSNKSDDLLEEICQDLKYALEGYSMTSSAFTEGQKIMSVVKGT